MGELLCFSEKAQMGKPRLYARTYAALVRIKGRWWFWSVPSAFGKIWHLYFFWECWLLLVLEYFTGAAMERIFHVRYWDYSNQKLNIHGYICVSSSLCWGGFSVLLVRVVHLPIETAVLKIPPAVAEAIAFVLAVDSGSGSDSVLQRGNGSEEDPCTA